MAAATEGFGPGSGEEPDSAALRAIGTLSSMARGGVPPEAVLALCLDAMAEAVPDATVLDAGSERPALAEAGEVSRLVLALESGGGGPLRTVVVSRDRPFTPAESQRLQALAAAGSAALTAAQAIEASRVDTLTRVLSRSALRERLDAEVARAARDHGSLACIVLDLDDFKAVNDDLGHLVGDDVLRTVGAVLGAAVRPFDHVGRLGGDEFVVVMPAVDRETAPVLAWRLHHALGRRVRVEGTPRLTCSLGVAGWEPGFGSRELLEQADLALLAAKRQGGDRVVTADGSARNGRPPSTPALRLALRGEGVSVCFQPICGIEDGALAGYEALARGPAGLERPDLLLAAAREAGELVALDERLHREAFRAAERLELAAPLTLFVNLEPETLAHVLGDGRLWRRTTRSFASITEVPERALLGSPGPLLRACQRLRELGWGIAITHAGTEPRALALLPLIAPDVVKLDVRGVHRAPDDQLATVVMALAAGAEATGMRVVAEGVEGEEQRRRAIGLGADYGQGWLFGRPAVHLEPGAGVAPLPRTPPPRPAAGVTPFQLVAATARPRVVDEGLLHGMQLALERRATGLGELAVLAAALPVPDPGRRVERRLAQLSSSLGCAALLADDASPLPEGRLRHHRLDASDPLRTEWVVAVVCPHSAVVLAARRDDAQPSQWRCAVSHEPAVAHAVAAQLLTRLP